MCLDNIWHPHCQLDLHQGWIIGLPRRFCALLFLESQDFKRVYFELFQCEVFSSLIGVKKDPKLYIICSQSEQICINCSLILGTEEFLQHKFFEGDVGVDLSVYKDNFTTCFHFLHFFTAFIYILLPDMNNFHIHLLPSFCLSNCNSLNLAALGLDLLKNFFRNFI